MPASWASPFAAVVSGSVDPQFLFVSRVTHFMFCCINSRISKMGVLHVYRLLVSTAGFGL